MTVCVRCGHDPDARVLQAWAFTVEREVKSLNAHAVNAGRARHAYRRDRDAWILWFKAHRRGIAVAPAATGKRRVKLTRLLGKGQREFDFDNLIGGCKVVLDAMVRAGLLRGDTAADVEVSYSQGRAWTGGSRGALHVRIEEIG